MIAKSAVNPPKPDTAAPKPSRPSKTVSLPKRPKIKPDVKAMARQIAHKVHHSAATANAARKKREAARRAVRKADLARFAAENKMIHADKRAAEKAAKRRALRIRRVKAQIKMRHAPMHITRASRSVKATGWSKRVSWR